MPALFACALARKLKSSNNFVLQATSRCLRQVPGNMTKARIYLSLDNRSILDRQLQETYGETISELNRTATQSRQWLVRLRKIDIPPLVLRKTVRSIVRMDQALDQLRLAAPQAREEQVLTKTIFTLGEQAGSYHVLQQVGDSVIITSPASEVDLFKAAVDLAANYHLDPLTIYGLLRAAYPEKTAIPKEDLTGLAQQIEEQTRHYEIHEEAIEVALALIKPKGFQKEVAADGTETYTAEISYPIHRQELLTRWDEWKTEAGKFGFHYDPYNFDSSPERSFFSQLLGALQLHPELIEDVYFTGALTDPQKTDFFVEYKGEDHGWHRYTPDFIIRRKDGKCLIVEIKSEHDRSNRVEGEGGEKSLAIQKWVGLNPDRLKYQMIFTDRDEIGYDQAKTARKFIEGNGQ